MLLTTHYMFEADALCDRIAVIAKGEIVAEGTPRELKAASRTAPWSRSRPSACADEAVERRARRSRA